MKELVLHIGRHKSGTSSLQSFLFDNQDLLKEKKVLYPTVGLGEQVAHHELAKFLNLPVINEKKFRNQRRKLREEARDHDKIIISSEEFQNCKKPERIVEFFQGFKLHVVIYFREILDYLQSAYAQSVQNTQESRTFTEFAQANQVDYLTFLKRWEKIADTVSIRYFNRDVLFNNDIVDDFFNVINVEINDLSKKNIDSNPSIGGNLLFFKLRLNQMNINPSRQIYREMTKIARLDKSRFASGFAINDNDALEIRKKYIKNNMLLEVYTDHNILRDFSEKTQCPNLDTLEEDLTFILENFSACELNIKDFLV